MFKKSIPYIHVLPGEALFSQFNLTDTEAGIIMLIASLLMLCSCLVFMVKLLNSMMKGPIAKTLRKTINSDLPSIFRPLTGYLAIIIGAIMTILVQSSSVFTSTLTPLVGLGLVKLERMYPLTLGSNIGTTMTGILAALAAPGDKMGVALQIALCHLFFNVSGILLFFPIPAMRRLPIRAAKVLGKVTAEYRWFAIAYLIFMFLLLPLTVFGVSFTGTIPSICIGSLVLLIVTFVVVVNILQSKCPKVLPKFLQTWKRFPSVITSLKPYDDVICSIVKIFKKCFPCCKKLNLPQNETKNTYEKNIAFACRPVQSTETPLSSKDNSPAPSVCSSTLALTKYERVPSKTKVRV